MQNQLLSKKDVGDHMFARSLLDTGATLVVWSLVAASAA
jgi:hypothetical protein